MKTHRHVIRGVLATSGVLMMALAVPVVGLAQNSGLTLEQRLQRVEDELAIRRVLVDLYGTPPPGFVNNESYHLTSNPEINVNGDRATARSAICSSCVDPGVSRRRRWPVATRTS